jgi:hypothetical protein
VSHITEVLETRKKTGVNNVAAAAKSRCPHGDRARQQVPQTATKCVQQKYEVQRGLGPKAEPVRGGDLERYGLDTPGWVPRFVSLRGDHAPALGSVRSTSTPMIFLTPNMKRVTPRAASDTTYGLKLHHYREWRSSTRVLEHFQLLRSAGFPVPHCGIQATFQSPLS